MENVAVHAGQPGAEAAPAQEPPKENTDTPTDGGAPTVSTPEAPAKPGICTQVCDYVADNWKPMLIGAAAGAAITAGAVWAFGSKEAPVVI